MIELLDGYYLDADDYPYQVFRACTRPVDKVYRVDTRYYTSLRSALLHVCDSLIGGAIKNKEVNTLQEVIDKYDEIYHKLEVLLDEHEISDIR